MAGTIEPLGDYFGRGTLWSNLALAMAFAGDPVGARVVMQPRRRIGDQQVAWHAGPQVTCESGRPAGPVTS